MKYSDEQIFLKITSMMEDLFEIPASDVKLDSRINEDLDLDSIDAIDLITELQNFIGHRLQPDQFKNVRTVSDIIVASQGILNSLESNSEQQNQFNP